ncbi:MAG: histidine phosphatase family protein [Sporichthyaceae bacterium]
MAVSLQSGGLTVTAHTELVLIRHGEAERGLPLADRGDPWLSERGHEQARRAAGELALDDIDVVYSSHLRRARQTAAPLCAAKGIEPQIREGIAEFDRKADEYMFFEDLRRNNDPRYFACMEGDLTAWGMSFEEFRAEAIETLTEIVAAHTGKRIAIFTHGGVLNVVFGHVLGLDRMWFFFPDNGAISRVAVNPKGKMRVMSMNERAHLRGLETPHSSPQPDAVPAQ